MSTDYALMLTSRTLWTTVLVAAPVLLVALVVGLLVSILQVVTQIQEMSLSFVPKLFAVVGVLMLAGPWLLRQLLTFASGMMNAIPGSLS